MHGLEFIAQVVALDDTAQPALLGSGVVIAADRVLTCRHVVLQADPFGQPALYPVATLRVGLGSATGWREIIVRDIAVDARWDLALLTLAEDAGAPGPVFLHQIGWEQRAYLEALQLQAFGYPGVERGDSLWRSPVTPLLPSFRAESNRLTSLQLAGGLPAGLSGGPVLAELAGRWVCLGVIYLGSEQAATSRLITTDAVLDFLRRQEVADSVLLTTADALAPGPPLPRTIRRSLLAAAGGVLLAGVVALTAAGQAVDERATDLLFAWRGVLPAPADIVTVHIDEPSLAEVGRRWPWPRTLHAELIDALARGGAAVVALDLIFAEPSPDPGHDQRLAGALRDHGNVILASQLDQAVTARGYRQTWVLPLRPFQLSGAATGYTNLAHRAGVVRGVPFFDRGVAQKPLSAAAAAALAARFPDRYPHYAPAPDGRQLTLNFAGPAGTLRSVSYYQALSPETYLPADFFRDKLVLVGATANVGGGDVFRTPFSRSGAGLTSGVEIHATAAHNLLRGNYLTRVPAAAALAAGFAAAVAFGWLAAYLRPAQTAALALTVAAAAVGTAALMFSHYHCILPLTGLLLPVAVTAAAVIR